jgi:hypothetical protein
VSTAWQSALYSVTGPVYKTYRDYRASALSHFELLAMLCQLANDTMQDALELFAADIIVNTRLQSRMTMNEQAKSLIDQFQLSTPKTFIRTLDFVRRMTQGNAIITGPLTNWIFVTLHTDYNYATLYTKPRMFDNQSCSCGMKATCVEPAIVFDKDYDDDDPAARGEPVPGMLIGCYPIESLLQSTLVCLYNETCVNLLMSVSSNYSVPCLDPDLSMSNKTVQMLVNTLFVETWTTNVEYDAYFAQCKPVSCTYTFNERQSLLYVISLIIGLYGGLTIVLKLLVPIPIKLVRELILYRQGVVQPIQ